MEKNNLTLTTLSSNPEYFDKVIALIEEEFHYTSEYSFEKDFAPLMNPLNFENCYLYFDHETNTVAAHLAICIRTLIKGKAEMKVAFVGGIVTHKKYREQKLFKKLMEQALDIHQNDVALFILWSDLENMYEKFNFYHTGGVIESGKKILGQSNPPPGYVKTKFLSLADKDFKTIVSLYSSFNEKYFFTIKREDQDWSIIREMASVDLYVKRSLNSEIIKYFCLHKGRDLTNVIHEISCRNESEFKLMLKDLEMFKLWLPESDGDKISNNEMFYNAFVRLGNIDLLNDFLKIISQDKLIITKMDEELISFNFEQETYHCTQKDFLQYIFGPKPLEEFQDFKLSFYISGLDSV